MNTLLLADGNNLFWRSFHGLRQQRLATADGVATWAIHGTILTVATSIKRWEPTHILVAFDWGKSAYRREIFPAYKDHRDRPPADDMEQAFKQLDATYELLDLFQVPVHKEEDTEADDIIATCARRYEPAFDRVVIISGDKDLRQLVSRDVIVAAPALGGKTAKEEEIWDLDAVLAKYGVPPKKLREVWALTGDVSDGIPGVHGIGEKTAIKLIQRYGSAWAALQSDEKKLQGQDRVVSTALKLVALDGNVARCSFGLKALRWRPRLYRDPLGDRLYSRLTELGLVTIRDRWMQETLWRTALKFRRVAG